MIGVRVRVRFAFAVGIRVRVRLAFASTGIEGRMSESKVEVLDRSSTTTNR